MQKKEFNISTVEEELNIATMNYPGFHSAHEGYAVLLEEVDELWDLVRLNPKKRDVESMKIECVQIAAMAIRFYLDCCEENGTGYLK